ncbi:MAG TPA: DinB family protein [Anaerolineales bacterium]|nr:DinB family protein [Anaerolineales bacterium]
MTESVLAHIFEHNNWANLLMLDACEKLTEAQLDAEPHSATKGTIRETLSHFVRAQQNYLRHLTRVEPPFTWETPPPLEKMRDSLTRSGQGFLEIARDEAGRLPGSRVQTRDGSKVEPWVIMLQTINHATEHREQINSMLTALGVTPLDLDGWSYASQVNAITPAND